MIAKAWLRMPRIDYTCTGTEVTIGAEPLLTCPEEAMYRVGHVPKWLCTELDMSRSDYVPKRLCPETVMSRSGYVPKRLCPETVMSRNGYVPKWLCPETVMSRSARHSNYWGDVRQEHTNKVERQSVQDGCKTGHGVWCRMLGS